MTDLIAPFTLAVPQADLDDLQRRLNEARWPERETVDDWSQGVPLGQVEHLIEYWKHGYDWRRCEAMLNGSGQYTTEIDGLVIHYLHVRSPHPGALPLLLTHGWPGSVIEFHKVIGPLTDPPAHGGRPEDAFDVVIPSLPGYAFSGKPDRAGWNIPRIARAWDTLMTRLGYPRYVAQGGDWGSAVTTVMGAQRPPGLAAIHVNLPLVLPPGPYDNLSPEEARMMQSLAHHEQWGSGYARLQATRPQTLGYALADSPAGQAAWIYEKFWSWSDCNGDPLSIFSLDELLDNVMLYWLSNSAASSARLYWESFRGGFRAVELELPVGCSIYPKEVYRAPRSWADRCIHNLIYWNELDRGGHFAAFEQPGVFIEELRACFRKIR